MRIDDCHAHTSLSYCADRDISPGDYVDAIERGTTLRTVAITNHGFSVYFPEDLAWSWRFLEDPSLFDERLDWGNRRLVPHLDEVEALRDRGLRTGIEVEMMRDGRLTVDPRLRDRLEVIVGSVHVLRSDEKASGRIVDAWMRHVRELVGTGIHVLGHPLRWLGSKLGSIPAEVVPFVVEAARAADVAVEINSHYVVEADADLLLEAVRQGARVAFATDAHRASEIGRFDYHLGLVESVGLRIEDIRLWTGERAVRAGR